MNQRILFGLFCLFGVTIAANFTNKTLPTHDDVTLDADDESSYTVDVLLVAGEVSTIKDGQNETGLSIRLIGHDGTISAWYRLFRTEESNYFGQRNYLLSGNTRDLGIISRISLRIDKPELAASSMPYYLCIHGTTNNGTNDVNWNGCTYIQSFEENQSDEQQYPLRDADGKLI